jgi:pimeloyl-ACP methyl ester carboxylesterase
LARGIWYATAITVILLFAGLIYEQAARYQDARRYPAPGQMVDIGSGRLHVHCTGQGWPVVILEGGSGADSSSWSLVQPEVARFTTVCSYDRAGYGWSDDGLQPRSKARIASELHELLSRMRKPPPFLLVGHSFGGEIVRVYAEKYPAEVAGLVLVATAPSDDWDRRMPGAWVARVEEHGRADTRRLRLLRLLAVFGVLRLWSGHPYVQYVREHLPHKAAEAVIALARRGRPFAAVAAEDAATDQDRVPTHFGDRPMIVLSDRWALAQDEPREEIEAARSWDTMERELAMQSTRGKRIVVEGTGHMIPLERPGAIVAAIRSVADQLHYH